MFINQRRRHCLALELATISDRRFFVFFRFLNFQIFNGNNRAEPFFNGNNRAGPIFNGNNRAGQYLFAQACRIFEQACRAFEKA